MKTFFHFLFIMVLPFGVFSSMALDELSPEALARKNLISAAIVLVVIYIMFKGRRRSSKLLSDVSQARFTDISHQQRPLPKELQRFLPGLTRSGFVRLGEVQRDTPRHSEIPIFVFVHKDRLCRNTQVG